MKEQKKGVSAAAADKEEKKDEEVKKEDVKAPTSVKVKNANLEVPMRCGVSDSPLKIGGPIWTEPIHDISFVQKLYDSILEDDINFVTKERIQGLLGGILDEDRLGLANYPLNYDLDAVSKDVKAVTVKKQ